MSSLDKFKLHYENIKEDRKRIHLRPRRHTNLRHHVSNIHTKLRAVARKAMK